MMRRLVAVVACSIIVCSVAGVSLAQTLGAFTDAGPSSDGEGSIFMLAGNDAFRTGIAVRFNLSNVADFGVQLGFDRVCKESFWAGGVDVKLVLLRSEKKLPLNLALDGSFGKHDSRDIKQYRFGFSILASGVIETSEWRRVEPYLSFGVLIDQTNRDSVRGSEAASCLCIDTEDETKANTLVRPGVKISVSQETQILVEAEIGDHSIFGLGFNVIF